MKQLLKVPDLCELLQCRPSYVYGLVHERKLPFIKLGHRQLRFDPEKIEAWLAERALEARNVEVR